MWLEPNSGAGVQTPTLDRTASESKQEYIVRKNSWFGKVFSFPVVLGALLVVLTVLTVRGRFNDPDMWWHLKTGEIIWKTHSIPRVDVFSYTTNHHPYVPHEWLSQLTIYAAYYLGGYSGLMVWLCVFASLIVAGGYVLCWVYSSNPKVAFLGAVGIWFFATVGLAIRPQLIGYLLLVCELVIIHLGRTRSAKWFFALPPLFAIWANCHGSFFFGLVVLCVALLSDCVEIQLGLLGSRRRSSKSRKALLAALSVCVAALFLNPSGLSQVMYPINTMFGQKTGLEYSSEWQPAAPSDPRLWALIACAALIVLVPLLRTLKLRLEELWLVALTFGLCIQHERLLFVFGIVNMPILCRLLASAWDGYEPSRDSKTLNATMIALAAIPVLLGFPSRRDLVAQIEKQNPVKGLDFINRAGLSGRMLNEYVYGGYLIWAAPNRKVFVDGRADVFEWTGVLDDYTKWISLQTDPKDILEKYNIDFCLLSQASPMARVVRLLPGWKSVYSDQMSLVFVRSAASAPVMRK